MTRTDFTALNEAAETEMRRLHPTWNENTYTWILECAKVMRKIRREGK